MKKAFISTFALILSLALSCSAKTNLSKVRKDRVAGTAVVGGMSAISAISFLKMKELSGKGEKVEKNIDEAEFRNSTRTSSQDSIDTISESDSDHGYQDYLEEGGNPLEALQNYKIAQMDKDAENGVYKTWDKYSTNKTSQVEAPTGPTQVPGGKAASSVGDQVDSDTSAINEGVDSSQSTVQSGSNQPNQPPKQTGSDGQSKEQPGTSTDKDTDDSSAGSDVEDSLM